MSPTGYRALVVEDNYSWQQILAEILTDAGLEVDVAGSLDQAVSRMRSKAHILAVVDLSLGSDHRNQDGLRLLDGLRRFDPKCKGILLTGFATVELAVSALTEYGALTCLRKEAFNRAEFRELIQRILASFPPPAFDENPAGGAHPDDLHHRKSLAEKKEPTSEEQTSQKLVLVVEDDAGWQSILAEILIDAGAQVRLCGSFGEALGCLRREHYHLAVVDLSLQGPANFTPDRWEDSSPGQDLEGYRLLASTRAGGIPTVVVSGVLTSEGIERTFTDQGIFAFLQKQAFNRQNFLQTVKEALAAGPPYRELDGLTDREREVLKLLARGLTNKEIADVLVISTNTVKRHLKAIFDKLEVHTRSAAAARAISSGAPGK
jgi:DNA-binding NarL/FixJ family response regulator